MSSFNENLDGTEDVGVVEQPTLTKKERFIRNLNTVCIWILRIFYIVLGVPQNLLGFIGLCTKEVYYYDISPHNGDNRLSRRYIRFIREKVLWKRYRLIKTDKFAKGFSVGMYLVFAMDDNLVPAESAITRENGHRILSMLFGPLHMFIIGIPRFIFTVYYNSKAKPKLLANGVPEHRCIEFYNNFYTERWAIKLGNL